MKKYNLHVPVWKSMMSVENDVVLIYFEERPAVFARLEAIEPDIKKDWYHVTLLLLTIPTQTVTWILRDTYINGAPFTMDGKPVRLEPVKKAELKNNREDRSKLNKKKKSKTGTVIPLKKN